MPSFWKAYQRLPQHVQRQARQAYTFFASDPRHRSLEFKRVHHNSSVYSVRVSNDYRALGVQDENDIVWFWIGPHHEYDQLLKRL